MKKYIIKTIAAFIPAIAFLSCSDNSWNNTYLDGFKGGPSYSNSSTGEVALSTNDYNTISTLLSSIATTDEEKAAASAIKSNQYFDATSPYPASVAIPYYLASTSSPFFNFANGSTVNVSYSEISGTPEEISKISKAKTYTLTASDYQEVWGSTSDYVNSFAPEREPEAYLPAILKSQYPEANEGDYAVVTYNLATQNPMFGESGVLEITDAIKDLEKGSNLNAVAVVTGQSTVGLILTDNAGSIFYYNKNIDLSAYPIGSIVKVTGQVDAYNHGLQLTDQANISLVGSEEYVYPEPINYTSSMIDTACAVTGDMLATYASFAGKLSISGNYYNVEIPGATAQGSLYNLTDEIKAKISDGGSYYFYGYFMAVSGSGKYFNLLVTDVEPVYTGELTSSIKDIATGDNLSATAVVTAQCSRGLILSDNAGSILYYNTDINLDSYPIGTVVKVNGTVSAYNKGLQLSNSATIEILGKGVFSYPEAPLYTAAMVEKACEATENMLATYVSLEGTLTVSGSYYNIKIDGAEAQGSLYYATDAVKDKLINGEKYIFYGYFMAISGSSPKYFNIILTDFVSVASNSSVSYSGISSRSASYTPAASTVNAVYYFNGSAWTKANDVAILNPADYEAMDDPNNGITSPAIKIPLYLKAHYPYAVEGDIKYVAYNVGNNSCACGLYVFDGNIWNLNNNGLEALTAQFAKNNDSWKFVKYLGKAVFNLFEENEIMLNRTYMLVYGTAAATPIPTSNSYGYLQKTEVAPSDGVIVMTNDANGFTFATTCIYNDNVFTAPNGYFIIKDSNGRYLYLQGTYASFNVRAESPYIEDGQIADGYLFSAKSNGDGTWTITNKYNDRVIYYADNNYSNFAAYATQSDSDRLPYLYLLAE